MNRVVYKYLIDPNAAQNDGLLHIRAPGSPQWLCVNTQPSPGGDQAYVWALIDPQADEREHPFRIMPTGIPFDDTGLIYLSTIHFQDSYKPLVFHVFCQ